MYSSFSLALKYIHYFLTASNGKGHGIHSPFVFEFITKVLNDNKSYPAYERVEHLRSQLLIDHSAITIDDMGAGSSVSKSNQRKVSSIAKNAAKPKKYAQLLYRIVQYYKPGTIVELGTSLGISSSYLALANPSAKIITLEGAASIAGLAQKNFKALELNNIQLIKGNFDDTLSSVISKLPSVEFAFIDGNHRQDPTINYFDQLLSKSIPSAILIFDDIHWSREMEEAWEQIKDHGSVTCTIDLFFIGLVFFRNEFMEKQHFKIRF